MLRTVVLRISYQVHLLKALLVLSMVTPEATFHCIGLGVSTSKPQQVCVTDTTGTLGQGICSTFLSVRMSSKGRLFETSDSTKDGYWRSQQAEDSAALNKCF